jgi:hypothetical protein
MATNDYQFITHWRVEGSAADAYGMLVDAPGYLRWWPQVYLGVSLVTSPGEDGLGGVLIYTPGASCLTPCAGRPGSPKLTIRKVSQSRPQAILSGVVFGPSRRTIYLGEYRLRLALRAEKALL